MMFSKESDHWCPLAREPPRRCGMLSNVRPLNQAAQAPAYAGRHALLSTNKDLIICVVGTHRYQEACAISQLYLLHHQQLAALHSREAPWTDPIRLVSGLHCNRVSIPLELGSTLRLTC